MSPERQADPRGAAPEGPGPPKWEPMGPKTCQNPPKSSQIGDEIESKWGQKPVQNGIRFGVLKNVDFSIFGSIFYLETCLNLIDFAKRFGAWIDEF